MATPNPWREGEETKELYDPALLLDISTDDASADGDSADGDGTLLRPLLPNISNNICNNNNYNYIIIGSPSLPSLPYW